MLGLNINLTKSDMVRLGNERDIDSLARVMNCKAINLPIKYLGLPLGQEHEIWWYPGLKRGWLDGRELSYPKGEETQTYKKHNG